MKNILIDLDGTIINSMMGVTSSVQYALSKVNIEVNDLNSLKKHIGPPLKEGFMNYYNMSETESDNTVLEYRKFYKEKGVHMNELYEGISDLIRDLRSEDTRFIVATSKPEIYARQILESFNIIELFHDVCGATLDGTRSNKTDVIRYALEKHKIVDLNNVIMVGDTKYDIEGANAVGIPSIGVLYGFGTKEEIEQEGADYIVDSVKKLRILLEKDIKL